MNPISHKIDLYFEKYDRSMSKREVILHGLQSEAEAKRKGDWKLLQNHPYEPPKKKKFPVGKHLRALLLSILAGGAVGAGASAIHNKMQEKK